MISDKLLSLLAIRPRFVGLAARPRAATLPRPAKTGCPSGKAVGSRGHVRECSVPARSPLFVTRAPRSRTAAEGRRCSTGSAGSAGVAGRSRAPQGFPRRGIGTCHDSPRWCSGLSNTSDTRLGALPPTKRGRGTQVEDREYLSTSSEHWLASTNGYNSNHHAVSTRGDSLG